MFGVVDVLVFLMLRGLGFVLGMEGRVGKRGVGELFWGDVWVGFVVCVCLWMGFVGF